VLQLGEFLSQTLQKWTSGFRNGASPHRPSLLEDESRSCTLALTLLTVDGPISLSPSTTKDCGCEYTNVPARQLQA